MVFPATADANMETAMLTQVEVKNFDKLEGILKRNIVACNLQDRTQFDYVKATATLFSTQGNIGIWTDNIDDPHLVLIVTSGKFGVINEVFGFVNAVYIDRDHRSAEKLRQMLDTAKLWARAKGCRVLQVSSWLYRGCEDIGDLWEALGYEVQETIYVTEL